MTYEVEYKRPPKTAQFKKGASGNPKGRPKGRRNLKTDLLAELAETVRISEGGSQRAITKQRALLKSLTAKAISGDIRAARVVLGLMHQLLSEDQAKPVQVQSLAAADQAISDLFLRNVSTKGGQSIV